MDRPLRERVPRDNRLALIVDADRGDIACRFDGGRDMADQFLGVVLHMAGGGIDLPVLEGGDRGEAAVFLHAKRFRAGGALVDGEDGWHQASTSSRCMRLARSAAGGRMIDTRRSGKAARRLSATGWPSARMRKRPATRRSTRACNLTGDSP